MKRGLGFKSDQCYERKVYGTTPRKRRRNKFAKELQIKLIRKTLKDTSIQIGTEDKNLKPQEFGHHSSSKF